MIVTETIYIDDREFTKTYSSSGKYVVRDGISYEEAVDPAEFGRTYTEGDYIPKDPSEEITAQEVVDIILGRMP